MTNKNRANRPLPAAFAPYAPEPGGPPIRLRLYRIPSEPLLIDNHKRMAAFAKVKF